MTKKSVALGLGALTGVLTLIAMLRLVSGAFDGGMSRFAWAFCLIALVPWIVYAAWRARHGHLSGQAAVIVMGLDVVGLILVWLFTLGPVAALACALAAFIVIWVSDLPSRPPRGEDRFVRMEELQTEEPD
ncbi:MAG TPA: hypothetical protein VIT20_08945 [Propionibacteriaceae bacterium]